MVLAYTNGEYDIVLYYTLNREQELHADTYTCHVSLGNNDCTMSC